MRVICQSLTDTLQLGQRLGQALRGGEVIVLVGILAQARRHLLRGLRVASPLPMISRAQPLRLVGCITGAMISSLRIMIFIV